AQPMTLRGLDSIRHRIALFMVVALGIVAGALIAMGYRTSTADSVTDAEAAMGSAADQAAAIVDQTLAPIPDLIAALNREVRRSLRDDLLFTEKARALLGGSPKYYQMYQGRPDGAFVGVARADPRLRAEFGLPDDAVFVRNRIDGGGAQDLAWSSFDDP